MKILTGVLFISWAMVFEKPKEGKQENEKQDSLAGTGEAVALGTAPRLVPPRKDKRGRITPAHGVQRGGGSNPLIPTNISKRLW
jgi:hypothetical protein